MKSCEIESPWMIPRTVRPNSRVFRSIGACVSCRAPPISAADRAGTRLQTAAQGSEQLELHVAGHLDHVALGRQCVGREAGLAEEVPVDIGAYAVVTQAVTAVESGAAEVGLEGAFAIGVAALQT